MKSDLRTQKVNDVKAKYNYKIIPDKKLIIEAFHEDASLDFFKKSILTEKDFKF